MVFLRTWSGRRGAEVTREARLTKKTKTIILKLFMTSTKSSYFGKSLAERQSLHWKHFEAWMPLDIRFVPIVLQDFVSKISSISSQQKTDREQSLLNTDAVTNGFERWCLEQRCRWCRWWWNRDSYWCQRILPGCCKDQDCNGLAVAPFLAKNRSPPYLQCRAHAWQEK